MEPLPAITSSEDGDIDLYPSLVQCFGIILLGYISGKFSIITANESTGLNTFITTFSLPALIFVSLVDLDFSSVNWTFLLAIFLGKTSIFLAVFFVSIGVLQPFNPAKAALFAIFCTKSNDFAFGYPVLQAIYGTEHPDYPNYLYLMGPISLLILNPIGFIIMEISRTRSNPANQGEQPWKIILSILLNIIKNPIIIMTLLGVVGNLTFQHSMPIVIESFFSTLGSAFSASSLFMLGLSMVNMSAKAIKMNSIITSLILIITKSFILPIVTREFVVQLHAGNTTKETQDLSNYGFIYGTIPTTPTVIIFALKYDIDPDLIATSVTASNFVATPIMYITAKMATLIHVDPLDSVGQLDTFLFNVSSVGLVAALWVVVVIMVKGDVLDQPQLAILVLVISQGIMSMGAILFPLMNSNHTLKVIQFLIFSFGVLASRVSTAMLAVTILLLQHKDSSSTLKFHKYLVCISILVPVALVIALAVVFPRKKPTHGVSLLKTQAIVDVIVLSSCFLLTLACLTLSQRFRRQKSEEMASLLNAAAAQLEYGSNGSKLPESSNSEEQEPEDTFESIMSSIMVIEDDGTDEQEEEDLWKHKVLLLLLSISMFTGISLSIWTLVTDELNGIYLELVFLYGFLNQGQAILTFGLFGVDLQEVVVKVKELRRIILYRNKKHFPDYQDLDEETKAMSSAFKKYHESDCRKDVLHDIIQGKKRYNNAMRGKELVTWIIKRGLAQSRQEAEAVGRQLLWAAVIRHVDEELDFYDSTYIYEFFPKKRIFDFRTQTREHNQEN